MFMFISHSLAYSLSVSHTLSHFISLRKTFPLRNPLSLSLFVVSIGFAQRGASILRLRSSAFPFSCKGIFVPFRVFGTDSVACSFFMQVLCIF